jgi:membrane protease YdiL (CAAX protease family)
MSAEAPSSVANASPLSGRPRRAVAAWGPLSATIAVGLGVAVGLGATAALVAVVDGGRAVEAASILLTDAVLLAVVVTAATGGADRVGPATLGLRRTAVGPALGWGLAVLMGSWAINGLLSIWFGSGASGGGDDPVHLGAGIAVLLTLGVAVSAPIVEEIAFRGYLFPALTTWRGPWVGALITAALFGAAHVLALPAPMLAGVAAFGLGACLLRWFTGSLLPGIAIHSFNNAIVLAALTGGQLWWAILAAPLVALALCAPFSRTRALDADASAAVA